MRYRRAFGLLGLPLCACVLAFNFATETSVADDTALAEQIRALPTEVFTTQERDAARQMVQRNIRQRLQEANRESTRQWQSMTTRREWEKFRDDRLSALRESLGTLPGTGSPPTIRNTGRLVGDGLIVEKPVFESRPGLWVTANLYRPAKTEAPAPAILICHSHHNPKTQDELQTMGMSWARFGALVLVMDQLGHGERRQHSFRTAADYPEEFRVGRQDYFYRYDTSLQLTLVGESLMGWMVGDMMRGIDVLLAQGGVDRQRIILIGAVAGGGDPAAVTAALDSRVAVAVPFNFGGPQPENRFPLPDDSEQSFPYAGGGSWESTRNLRLSASEGFLPWVIVGGIAPRKLIYGHEFSWDQEHDPVWKRLQKIYGWYQADESLSFAHGAGLLQGKPPEATHCNNVGRAHRKMIYPALERWFQMTGSIDDEYSRTFRSDELLCWTDSLRDELKPKLAHTLATEIARWQFQSIAQELRPLSPAKRRDQTRKRWAAILGDIEPNRQPNVRLIRREEKTLSDSAVEHALLEAEPGITLPLLLLLPNRQKRVPLVVCVAQSGKGRFIQENATAISELLTAGVAVGLLDVRGTGETAPADESRDRTSTATSLSASEWMLGGTLLGARLRDLRTALAYLRKHKSIAGDRIALWGDSFAPINAASARLVVPHGIDGRPQVAAPLGGLLTLLAALFEDDVRAVYIRRGLIGYATALDSPAVYLPHVAIVPGAAAAGDLLAVLSSLPSTSIHFQEPIDGANRPLDEIAMKASRTRLQSLGGRVAMTSSHELSQSAGPWLTKQLTKQLADAER